MINEYQLKITGSASLSEKIEADKVVIITNAELSCYSVEKKDNQDGTFDISYKCRITSPVELEQGGKVIKGTDRTGESKKTRYCIKELGYELGEESEEFYKIFQQKLRSNIHEVWQFLKHK